MRSPVFLIVPLLLLGCTQDQGADSAATASNAAVGGQVACIEATRVAGRRAENNRTLVFELTGGQTYRNDLEETCPGIERASSFGTLAIDPIENRLCRGDMVRVYDPAELGRIEG
jgi:hypothetical protein